jgi:hypothetical protein
MGEINTYQKLCYRNFQRLQGHWTAKYQQSKWVSCSENQQDWKREQNDKDFSAHRSADLFSFLWKHFCGHHRLVLPSHLYVVGPVSCKNHTDEKLMARPSKPLAVATTQNIGSLITSLQIKWKSYMCKWRSMDSDSCTLEATICDDKKMLVFLVHLIWLHI